MTSVGRRTLIGGAARAAAVPVAACAVHQLRFWLAFGGRASAELTDTGHSYLHSVVPWIVLLVGLAAGAVLWEFGRALSGQRMVSGRAWPFVVLWLVCGLCLVAIYCAQESLEGLFAVGHPSGFAGIFGDGGWWAVPASVAVGLALAALFRVVSRALDAITRRCERRQVRTEPAADVQPVWRDIPLRLRLVPLVGGWSDRGPPAPI